MAVSGETSIGLEALIGSLSPATIEVFAKNLEDNPAVVDSLREQLYRLNPHFIIAILKSAQIAKEIGLTPDEMYMRGLIQGLGTLARQNTEPQSDYLEQMLADDQQPGGTFAA
jgi:hypothetical protein